MAYRRFCLLVIAFLAWASVAAFAQRCAGALNIHVASSVGGNNVFAGVSTINDSTGNFYRDHLSSTDNRFSIAAFRLDEPRRGEPFGSLMGSPNQDYLTFYFGCDGNYLLRIVRQKSANKSDTMLMYLDDICDESFGMNIVFSSGRFRARICDTTARDLEQNGMIVSRKYRAPAERYRTRLYKGYDITERLHAAHNDDERINYTSPAPALSAPFIIYVLDGDELPIANAHVVLKTDGLSTAAPYSLELHAYTADRPNKKANLIISCPGYISRTIGIQPGQSDPIIVPLAHPGEIYYYDLRPRPFMPHRDVICVVYAPAYADRVKTLTDSLGLTEIDDYATEHPTSDREFDLRGQRPSLKENGVHFYRGKASKRIAGTTSNEMLALRNSGLVVFAGCVIRASRENFLAFDNNFQFKPKYRADSSAIEKILVRNKIARKDILPPYDTRGWWSVTASPALGDGVLEIMRELWDSGRVTEMTNNFKYILIGRRDGS